jgi:hypothetical protein
MSFSSILTTCKSHPQISELIDCLRRSPNELQLNASWALTNLACGSRQETHRIIATGGVEALMQLASSATGEVRDQAIWALGNLAADCALCREHVRDAGLLNLLMMLLELPDYQAHETRKIMIWCLANLMRGGINDLDLEVRVWVDCDFICLFPQFQSVGRLLTSLHITISVYGTGDILCDAVWCVAYLIDHATVEGERVGGDILLQSTFCNYFTLTDQPTVRTTGTCRQHCRPPQV